ncbi:aldo-keto reductase family 1 member C1 homolog isoform X2 [Otolemur garnettii]|uniref:aldo-keto reductase family 1 member C1 homolog isoform X2 n=1 Tax=Otolemur garnettii TaxID=30611 RepID=UPI00064410E7|nr:aldo-keto reductase family 1 member C1 homolog isoform X2 [Otolemur garnettii]
MSGTVPLSVKLNDGHFMPTLGLGTSAPSKVAKSKVEEAIQIAIEVGYRHFDSAYLYLNEEEIGQALRRKMASGAVRREDVFYTSKVWCTFLRPELVQTCLERSLRKLQLSYVDLYLIHFPVSLKPGEDFFPKDTDGKIIFDTVDLCSTWEALEKCKDAGLAKSIGVSNFNRRKLEMILNKPGLRYKPVCNQVECHPYYNRSQLLEFCKSKDIVLAAYGALGTDSAKDWVKKGNPHLLEDPVLNAVAEKHRRSPAQVALRYQLQRGVVVLAKSFSEKRIRENFQVFDFQLTPEDMKTLDGLNRNMTYFDSTSLDQPICRPTSLKIQLFRRVSPPTRPPRSFIPILDRCLSNMPQSLLT